MARHKRRKQAPRDTCTALVCALCRCRESYKLYLTCNTCYRKALNLYKPEHAGIRRDAEKRRSDERARWDERRNAKTAKQAAALEQSASYRGDVPHYREDPTL
jgi:hypothetical protein